MILQATKWGALLARCAQFTAEYDETHLHVVDGEGESYSLDLLDIKSVVDRKGLIWCSLEVSMLDGTGLELKGAPKADADAWLEGFHNAHLNRLAVIGGEAKRHFDTWLAKTKKSLPNTWLSSWLPDQLYKESPPAATSSGHSYEHLAGHPGLPEAQRRFPKILSKGLISAPAALKTVIDDLNSKQLARELNRPLFDTLESTPLTVEQRTAVICFDNRQMLVAAAGSGKTATMAAKVAYGLDAGIVKPHEILMLAFNKSAAEELRERLDKRLGHVPENENIVCSTFHKFGLDVIGQASTKKPRTAPWLEGGQDIEKIVEIIDYLSETDKVFYVNLMLLKMVFPKPLGALGARELGPDVDAAGRRGFKTLKGDIVKSSEELTISDWLFFNGVNYQYEAPYTFDTATEGKSQYHPDFYYPEVELWHEHFALNSRGIPPAHFVGYAAGVEWKRSVHAENGTNLFETTSHTLRVGQGLKDLEEALTSRGIKLDPNPDRIPPGRPVMENTELAKILRTLITHAKGNLLSASELESRARKLDPIRAVLFAKILSAVLESWNEALRKDNYVDYDDMINLAVEYAESGAYRSPYRLICADEAQDCSYSRARLLRAIAGRPDAFLCVVGDDWQSINRFAGADIGVMRTFKSFYGGGTVQFLTRTFRCPQEICDVSSRFVQQNPDQIAKEVNTTSTVKGRAIQCFAAETLKEIPALVERDLQRIAATIAKNWTSAKKPTVMVLGRNWSDQPNNWGRLKAICGSTIELSYSTVHSSKGSEADYVLMVNIVKGRFPSEQEDDPVIQIATPEPEKFLFAEERRLFYVGLTRPKRGVFIYTVASRPSPFLTELVRSGDLLIQGADGELAFNACPQCEVGHQVLKTGKFKPFYGCSEFPKCDWRQSAVK